MRWGVRLTDGQVVCDTGWRCAADVVYSAHAFDIRYPVRVVVDRGDGWEDFWVR